MRKQKRGIAMLLIAVMVCVELIGGTGRAAAASTIQELTLYGTVNMMIPQDGQWNPKKNKYVNSPQSVLLEDYPITICYQDKKGKTVRQRAFTDSKGNYSARLRSADGLYRVWVEIRSENDACVVADQQNNKYFFESAKETIGSTQKSLSKKVQITGEEAKGAINIAQIINRQRNFMKAQLGMDVPKVTVYWQKGLEMSSYTIPKMGIIIAGEEINNSDEYDKSVICHEYSHWMMQSFRKDGIFIGGDHILKGKFDERLTFSEGSATFLGQSFLGNSEYVDGYLNGDLIKYNNEIPESWIPMGSKNEARVTASMWDITDSYNPKESWENLEHSFDKVVLALKKGIQNATLIVADIIDVTIEDFYEQYKTDYIIPNTWEACSYWNIFKYNGMQYDKQKPKIRIKSADAPVVSSRYQVNKQNLNPGIPVLISDELWIETEDDIKVERLEIELDGKKVETIMVPDVSIKYQVNKQNLSPGLHTLTVKAYDYAKNYSTKDIKTKPNNKRKIPSDIYQRYRDPVAPFSTFSTFSTSSAYDRYWDTVEYREPYEVEQVLLYVPEEAELVTEEAITASAVETELPKDQEQTEAATADSISAAEEEKTQEEGDQKTDSTQETTPEAISSPEQSETEPLLLFSADYPTEESEIPVIQIEMQEVTSGAIDSDIRELAEAYHLDTVTEQSGQLQAGESTAEQEIVIEKGMDYAFLVEDVLCDTEITITAPDGTVYTNEKEPEQRTLVNEETGQAVLNLGSMGLMVFHPQAGVWKYQIRSRMEGQASFASGIYRKLSAPVLENEEELWKITSGSGVTLKGYAAGEQVHIIVAGEETGTVLDTTFPTPEQEFAYSLPDLADDFYTIRLYALGEAGKEGWDGNYDLVVASEAPEIELDEDYEFYHYYGEFNDIKGNAKKAVSVTATLNGQEIKVEPLECEKDYSFYIDTQPLQDGENRLVITAENAAGLQSTKELILVSYPDTSEIRAAEVKSIEFDGMDTEPAVITGKSKITLKLTDPEVERYQVRVYFYGNSYTMTPEGDHFVLNLDMADYYNDKTEMLFYVNSQFQTYDRATRNVQLSGGKERPIQVKEPENVQAVKGEEITLRVEDICKGENLTIECELGTIQDGIWHFTPEDAGVYWAYWSVTNEEDYDYVSFPIHVSEEAEPDNRYAVEFNPNGGEVEEKSRMVEPEKEYGSLPIPTRAGYQFAGWFTEQTAGSKIEETTLADPQVTVLYARWVEIPQPDPVKYTVTFHGNGANVSPVQKQVVNGQMYGELPKPEMENYSFQGWYTRMVGGERITETSIVSVKENPILYARWEGVKCKVSLDSGGGTISQTEKEVSYGARYDTLPTPTKTGCTFNGWFTKKEGGEKVTSSSVVNRTTDHTLYAAWSGETVVTLNANGGNGGTTKKVVFGQPYGDLAFPTRSGYTFLGWFTEKENGTEVKTSDVVQKKENHTLYAHWKPNQYTITLYNNGGTQPISSIEVEYGASCPALPVPTLPRYHFDGWFTTPLGGVQYEEGKTLTMTSDLALYAKWTGEEHTIHFDPTGGSTSTVNKKVHYGEQYGTLPTPTRTGYDFLGWFTQPEGKQKLSSKDTVELTSDQTLYARWEVKEPVVTLNAGKGLMVVDNKQVSTYEKQYEFGDLYGILPSPSRTGYTFTGWYTASSGGEKITENRAITSTSSHTIYAQYEPNRYQISFQAGEGSCALRSKEIAFDKAYGELPDAVRNNYTFLGWYTEKEGGTKISSATILKETKDQVVYARWKGKACKLECYVHEGESPKATYTVYYGETYANLKPMEMTGYDFLGWYTLPSGGSLITPDQIVNVTGTQQLYGKWSPKKIRIRFSAEGGNVSETERTVLYKESYGTLPIPTRKGYTFNGWYTTASGGKEIISGGTVELAQDSTLYAKWTGKPITVSFYAGEGSVTTSQKDGICGNTYGTLPTPKRSGYTFRGWYTKQDGGYKVSSTSKIQIPESHTLYALWTKDSYAITFSANGGTLKNTSYAARTGMSFSDFPVPEKEGYLFAGWYTSSTGGSKVTVVSAAKTLYAHWNPKEYILKFDPQGGTVSQTEKTVLYKKTYGTLPVPVRKNYTFLGWYNNPTGATKYTASSTVNFQGEYTIYAKWKGNAVTLNYQANGGTCSTKTKTVYYGNKCGTLATPSRTGYSFEGWYTAASGGRKITEDTVVDFTSAVTLYARWKVKEVTVKFSGNNGYVKDQEWYLPNITRIMKYGSIYGEFPDAKREGYQFLGWYTSSTGTVQVTAETVMNKMSDFTLYAHWKGIEKTLRFDPLGGQTPEAERTVIYGNNYGTLPVPTKTGKKFAGWYTKELGGKKISADTKADLLKDTTVYARWEDMTYSITCDGNGGSIAVEDKAYSTVTKSVKLDGFYGGSSGMLAKPSRTGYEFTGWYTEKEGGELVTADKRVRNAENHTIYAHWKPKNISLLLHTNGGESLKMDYRVPFNQSYGSLPVPVRKGHTFTGWYTSSTGTTEVTSETLMKSSSIQTVYAHWQPDACIITFQTAGGTVDQGQITAEYEKEYGTLPTPKKENYKFEGWFREDGSKVGAGSSVLTYGAHALYAKFSESSIKVTYEANYTDGSVTPESKQVYYGRCYGVFPAPLRSGYDFLGWYTESAGGNLVSPSDLVTVRTAHKLYAHWQPKRLKVVFNPNGGQVDTKSKDVNYRDDYGTLPTPTRQGYSFLGWYTTESGGSKVTESTQFTTTTGRTLYARWKEAQ